MTPRPDLRIAVIGAGIGGLSAALGLRRAGFAPVVFEQAARLGEVGAGLTISPNAAKGLVHLGLDGFLATSGDVTPQQLIVEHRSGRMLRAFDRSGTAERYGAAYYQLHRADLHGALESAFRLTGGMIRTGKRLRDLAGQGAALELEFDDGTTAGADVIIGCDGVRSTVRARVFAAELPAFSGHVAWRGLVPMDTFGARRFQPGSCVWVGPDQKFVRYPVRRGTLMNYVGFTRSEAWEDESWFRRTSIEELLASFEGWDEEVLAILRASPDGLAHRWGLFSRPPLENWTTDRLALLGDAAHPMLPWFGQGAASAIEDAVILARAFAVSASVTEALRRYEAARRPRVELIYRESMAFGSGSAPGNPPGQGGSPPRDEETLGLYHYDPATAAV